MEQQNEWIQFLIDYQEDLIRYSQWMDSARRMSIKSDEELHEIYIELQKTSTP